jgi:Sulfotransferase family
MDPLFIVGVPRSGTTLLVNLLGQHPLLAPLYETRFLRNLLELCEWGCWFYGKSVTRMSAKIAAEPFVRSRFLKRCQKYRSKALAYHGPAGELKITKHPHGSISFGGPCIHYTKEDLITETDRWLERVSKGELSCEYFCCSAREYVDSLFAIHCSRMKKRYWINKTPGLLTYLDRLPLIYPKSRCLHIVRDGRDIAVSNLSLSWGPATVREAARRWKNLMLMGRRKLDLQKLSYMEIRYEELLKSPDAVLKDALAFLGVDGCLDEILSHVPIFKEREAVWRKFFSRQDREIFSREAGDLLIELGYEKDYQWVR